MAKKRKLKKKVKYTGIGLLVILIIVSIFGVKTYKEYMYKRTYEYKLMEHGYTKEEADSLESYYSNDELDDILEIAKNDTILELIKEKYYIHKNLERYLTYYENNKDTSFKDIVAIVNVNRDYEYYENNIDSDTNQGDLLIVNKYYTLSNDFTPDNLVTISASYAYDNNSITKSANDAYVSMWNACKEAGYQLIVNSSYRNYEDQEDVYDSIKASKGEVNADKVAARPGHSEHQTGLAIDVFEINNQLTGTFKDSEAYAWLKENAYLYGYIERYPEDKEYLTGYSFESWHWRYVGKEAAKVMHDEDITFDEYYAYYIENQN
jgi:D-alanyl-D-alanine carboxypeptidase